jgi:hypothetical protein
MFIRNKQTIAVYRVQVELMKAFCQKAKSKKLNFSEAIREAMTYWLNKK